MLLVRQPGAPAAAPEAAAPFAGQAADGGPPDLSQMSPREQFDRLYNRVMQASEAGDQATVTQFSPMALQAYGMLDEFDADARYHAAMIRLTTGDAAGAAALADTILAGNPNHLLGLVVQANVARARKDDNGFRKAQQRFLAEYATEEAAGHQEYADHKVILDQFLQAAQQATPGRTTP
ncbi:MAG: hypothetical protein AB7L66_11660 [Gemmatimonadales bacterium]